jgi:hypothetical protein
MESKLATFRLFVQHGRPLESSKEERDLRQQFEKFGRVTSFSTRRGECRNSQVTFSSTSEAIKAKETLDKTRLNGMTLKILFTKPSRRVLVRGLPNNVSLTDLKKEFHGAVHAENDGEHVVAITFDTISVAQAAVGNSGMRTYRGRELSFDFGNEERGRRRHSSPPRRRGSSPRRSREVIRGRSPSPRTEYKRRSRTPPVRSVRKRSRSRSKSARVSSGKSAAKKLALSSSSSSSPSSSSRERKRSKPKKESVENKSKEKGDEKEEKEPEQKEDVQQDNEIPQVNDVQEEPPIVDEVAEAVVAHHKEVEAEEDGPCRDCVRLLADLKDHVGESHAESHVVVQKATIKAWFEAHYSREGPNNNGAGEIASAVTRTTLLAEVNAFFVHMGWPKWKTQSPLYKDWFLREVMALSDDDIRKGRNWSLFHKDGFAPGGDVENARNKEQRMTEIVAKLRQHE